MYYVIPTYEFYYFFHLVAAWQFVNANSPNKKQFYLFCVPRTPGTPDRHTSLFFLFCDFVKGEEKKIFYLFVFNNNNNNMIDYTRRFIYIYIYIDPILVCLFDCPVLCATCIFWIASYNRDTCVAVVLNMSVWPTELQLFRQRRRLYIILHYYKYIPNIIIRAYVK